LLKNPNNSMVREYVVEPFHAYTQGNG